MSGSPAYGTARVLSFRHWGDKHLERRQDDAGVFVVASCDAGHESGPTTEAKALDWLATHRCGGSR